VGGVDVDALLARWRTVFRRKAPLHLPRHLLFRTLAYRLQAEALGDLDPATRQLLDKSGSSANLIQLAEDLHRIQPGLRPGTVLTREWDGHLQRVMVLADGFSWRDKTYPSLSKVASAITGRLGSIYRLLPDLRKRGIVTELQRMKTGSTIGGIPFTSGPLSYLLRNRFYIGEVVYKDEILPGEQPPIIDRELFEAVQAKLTEQQNNHIKTRAKSETLLIGLIFDDRGNRMSPSHARKQGVKYRYYISLPLLQGQPEQVGSVHRVPAAEIETVIGSALRHEFEASAGSNLRDLINAHVARVDVRANHLVVELKRASELEASEDDSKPTVIHVPWQKPPSKKRREIIVPQSAVPNDDRPIRADARARLVAAIARGRRWLDELTTGAVADIDVIAARERCSIRKVNMTISLAFLAPDLVKAAIEGRLPRGIGLARLCDPPAEWSRQHQALGLTKS
jgi:hypothetical protein